MSKPPLHSLRTLRPTVDPAKAAELIAAADRRDFDPQPASPPSVEQANTPAVQVPAVPQQQSASGRKTIRRADGRELRKQTVYLEAGLARRLAVHCAATGQDLSEVVAGAVERLLAAEE